MITEARILDTIRGYGAYGATADELSLYFRKFHNSIAPTVTKLAKRGQIVKAGYKRMTRSGRRANVYIVA